MNPSTDELIKTIKEYKSMAYASEIHRLEGRLDVLELIDAGKIIAGNYIIAYINGIEVAKEISKISQVLKPTNESQISNQSPQNVERHTDEKVTRNKELTPPIEDTLRGCGEEFDNEEVGSFMYCREGELCPKCKALGETK
jgi:hypothetical protein